MTCKVKADETGVDMLLMACKFVDRFQNMSDDPRILRTEGSTTSNEMGGHQQLTLDISEDAMLDSPPSPAVHTPPSLSPLSDTAFCRCCNEVSDMKDDIKNILSVLLRVAAAIQDIQSGLRNFSYDVSLVMENARQWMAENGK